MKRGTATHPDPNPRSYTRPGSLTPIPRPPQCLLEDLQYENPHFAWLRAQHPDAALQVPNHGEEALLSHFGGHQMGPAWAARTR